MISRSKCVVVAMVLLLSPLAAEGTEYTIRSGDTLTGIARQFGLSVGELRAANGIRGDLILAGATLVIPEPGGLPLDIRRAEAPTEEAEVAPVVTSTLSAADLEVLARIVLGECPPHMPAAGKVAVAAVVLNRVRSPRFPDTVPGVAHQRLQFSCYNPGNRERLYMGRVRADCWAAAREAAAGADPTGGATHYFNPYLVQPSWARRLEFLIRIGETRTTTHAFYRERSASRGLSGSLAPK